MKKALAFLLFASLAACSAPPIAREKIADPGQLLFNGYVRADIDCYKCHAGNASGTWKGPRLAGITEKESAKDLRHAIRSGPSIMPSYDAQQLSDDEVDQILTWLGSLH